MATDIAGLFGLTPESYQLDQEKIAQAQALKFAEMDPFQRANYGLFLGGRQLAGGIGQALGVQDPQLQKISAVQSIAKDIDFSDLKSVQQGVRALSNVDPGSAAKLAEYANNMLLKQSEITKNLQAPKLTGDERYINILQTAENYARTGKEVPPELAAQANMAAQMLSKPRSFFDAASGKMITIPATDPSKAFPNIFRQFEMAPPTEGEEVLRPGVPTAGKSTAEQATLGNLPSTSQARIATIDSTLTKLESSGPELTGFLDSIKTGKVKFDATSNVFDFVGAVVPPAFGKPEFGNQVEKDKIERALKERANANLLAAKGTQTEGDAVRAADLVASASTRYSPARMEAAIESLINVENKLKKELGAERQTLLGQGRPVETPAKVEKPTVAKQPTAKPSTSMSDDQKIQRFIEFNGGKPSREEAIKILRAQGLISGVQ